MPASLRDFRQKCRIRVKINGESREALILFGEGRNFRPIGDEICLYFTDSQPGPVEVWFTTGEVELETTLDWDPSLEPKN